MRIAQLVGTWYNPRIRIAPGEPPALTNCIRTSDGWWERPWWTDPASEARQAGLSLSVAPSYTADGTKTDFNALATPIGVATSSGHIAIWPRLSNPERLSTIIGRALDGEPPWQVSIREAVKLSNRVRYSRQAQQLIRNSGIPAWFPLALYPYQQEGALRLASGLPYIADEPGLGKTRQTLAALAMSNPRRLIIVCPPVMMTAWKKEATASTITHPNGTVPARIVEDTSDIDIADWVVDATQPFPQSGVVVVSDSILVAREDVRRRLHTWRADGMIVDEAHRYKNAKAKRTRHVLRLASSVGGLVVAASGTPILASPLELVSQLKIVDRFTPVFGSFPRFAADYFTKRPWGEYVVKQSALPGLHDRLESRVWTRRYKKDVLTELPEKQRNTLVLDVDTTLFEQAHRQVREKIRDWFTTSGGALASMTEEDRDKELWGYSKKSLEFVSMMRAAAGLCKVSAATDLICDRCSASGKPLVAWIHHKKVAQALYEELSTQLGEGRVGMIVGDTPHEERARLVEEFQSGDLHVLIASIMAAGVGVTLTAASEAVMVETDWTPALVLQAEDRVHRISQKTPVTITTLVASRTLDESIHRVLYRKARVLDVAVGGDSDVSIDDEDRREPASVIVYQIVQDVWREYCKEAGDGCADGS